MEIIEEDISVEFTQIETDWNLKVFWRNVRIGYCWCEHLGDRLHISDLKVEEGRIIRWPVLRHLPFIGRFAYSKISFRQRGIGSRLINLIISEAAVAGVREIWGSVTQADIDGTPGLLQWYEWMGFIVSDPDKECIEGAARKITRKMLIS